ncbi:MAG: DUF2304 domain-containing protein [Chloroflexi bacterium]|nr:DUF2304 domain-containing protein [Chloroflexota bacterium]
MEQIRKAISRAAVPTAIVGTVFGFIGDVLQPLIDLAPIVAVISFVGALLALGWFVYLRRQKGNDAWDSLAGGLFIFFVAGTIIFSVLAVFFAAGPERGYLASNVDAIAKLQTDVLGIRSDVSAIKTTTQSTQQQVVAIATTQAQGFAEMQRSFAALQSGQGNLVTSPQTPQEWYSNARLYQLRGDTANALKAYEGYFKFNLEFVGPYGEYVAMLKATEGIARTRQIVGTMASARRDSATLDLVATRLLDSPTERLTRLVALTTRAPQFGPGWQELGQEYTRAVGDKRTKDMTDKQIAAFKSLLTLEEREQGFTRYYIDKTLADKDLVSARQALQDAENWARGAGTANVRFTFLRDQVIFTFDLAEQGLRKLMFSIDDPQPKTETGMIPGTNVVNLTITGVPVPVGEHTFYFQYVDANSVASAVQNKKFWVDPIAIDPRLGDRDFSTNTQTMWFAIGVVGAKPTDRYRFKYSVDSPALNQTEDGMSAASITIKSLKPGEHKLYIQATRADGVKTPVVEYVFTAP